MLDKLSIFGFQALWSPIFLTLMICVVMLYLAIVVGPLKKHFSNATEVKPLQILYFISAIILVYIIKGSPIDLLGHLNFSVHMTQMALLYLTVPPLLIFGTPTWLLRSILNIKYVNNIVAFCTKPLIALIFFNMIFSFYHFPFIFDAIKTDPILHFGITSLIFLGAMFMWWPLINPLPEVKGLSGLQKMGYIFADGILLTPACALIIFAQEPMYATYTDPALISEVLKLCVPASQLRSIDFTQVQIFSWLPPKEDQQLGGVIMKILQEIMYGIILAYNFFKWFKEEKDKDPEPSMMPAYPTK